ncbi:MAG: FAD-dependent oxidoreductase [Longicatena sp.]
MKQVDMVIIGGGSAGMSAALSAREAGVEDILILERSEELGGILQQCIHNGFGLQVFKEELTGPMYAENFMNKIVDAHIAYKLNTTVIEINKNREVLFVNEEDGYTWVHAGVIINACGCYERNRGAISIPGKRLAGVYTAGSAQRFLNIENICVGKNVFILGSGDIGLIMARRMTLEGAHVVGVAEIMPYSNGLTRNIVQCLKDYDIPLYLSHTITNIQGDTHVESITITQVDEHKNLIEGTSKTFCVDTLLLSIGLLPENEMGTQIGMALDPRTKGAIVNEYFETNIPHMYACGNALHVHDIVDFVSLEASEAGYCAAQDLLSAQRGKREVNVVAKEGVSYVLPQIIQATPTKDITLCMRPTRPFKNVRIELYDGDTLIKTIKKRYLLPAEMERIKLSMKEGFSIQSELKVQVCEE